MFLSNIFYSGILFVSTLLVYLSQRVATALQRNILFGLAFMVVFLPAAIRYGIGIDYFSYEVIFHQINSGEPFNKEIGYYLLNYVVGFFGMGFEGFVVVTSFISYYFIFKAYPRSNAWIIHFLFVCYLYLYTYSNIRSAIIYGLMFISVVYYVETKKLLPFLFSVMVAVCFHKTAVVYMLIPLLFSRVIVGVFNRRYVAEFFLVVLVLLFFQPGILHAVFFNNPLSKMFGFFDKYSNSAIWGVAPELGTGVGVFLKVLPLILFILFRRFFIAKDPKARYLVVLCLVLFACVDLSLAVMIAHRFEKYFAFVYFLVFYYFLTYMKGYVGFSFIAFNLVFYLFIFNKTIYDSELRVRGDGRDTSTLVAPYITIFNKQESSRESELFVR